MWSVLMWSELNWFMWSDFVLKWSEVSYGEVLEAKSTMYIRVTLHWGYLIALWLFHLVCILYCGCFNLFCNMWLCVCVHFVMSGCFGNMCTCIYCVLYFIVFTVFVLTCSVMCGWVYVGVFWKLCGCLGNMCTCIHGVLYCLYCVFCIVSFMYIYSYSFWLY